MNQNMAPLTAVTRIILFLSLSLTASLHAADLQVVSAKIPPNLSSLSSLGTLPGNAQLNLAISLPLRNPSGLSNLLQQIYNPASPNYHHYLTPTEFTEKFGPTIQDYQQLIAFAQANHLQVTATHPNRMLLDVSGSVADIQRALHVTLRTYQHPTENRAFYAPDSQPSLNLSVPVLQISGLDNYALPHPRLHATPLVNTARNVSPNGGSGPSGTFMGLDFRKAYAPDTTLNGSGQTVGLLQFDGYTPSDIAYYEAAAGLPNVPLQNVLLDGFTGNPTHSGGEVEVSLDIEMSISMATNLAKVIVYEAGPYGNWHDILNRMANDNLAKQLSCSWYSPGGAADPTADQIFQQMALQGQSFFNASGDNDAYTGLISFPGDTPYITQVGGTTLTTSTGGAWSSEKVWNWGNGIGSGGGISTQYPIPAWQTNISMTANQGSTTMRNTPDVALTADNVYVRADGYDYNVGGTSCAAPLWAGFAALVNQQAVASGQPFIGFVNPLVDAIGTGPDYALCFHDTITGNNTSGSSPTKFYAVAGYDLCTGWGTPAGQNLITALANPEPLRIAPATGFAAIGGVGGPFSVTSQIYSLTNGGTNTLTWSLSNTSAWLSASSTGGSLTPGGPAATVTVSLNNTASNLVVGSYSATLWFTNQNDNSGQSRQFTLSIISPPSITQQPTNQAPLEGATAVFNVQADGGLPLAYQWQFNGTNLTDGGTISGSATTSLTISNVSAANVGNYTVVVTNYAGTVTSSNATLTITPSPPVIVSQPQSQTVLLGRTASITLKLIGTTPFLYQWLFNGTNLIGATNAVLTITNAQYSNAGSYSVLVTNALGSIASSNAVLTVVPCDPVPQGIVSWWQGEGNAYDAIGNNHGTLVGAVTYTNGKVGQAFAFNGYQQCVTVGNPTNLQLQNFTIEAWVRRASSSVTTGPGGNGIIFTYGSYGYGFYLDNSGIPSLSRIGVDWTQPSVAVTDTNFHHLAVTKSNSVVFFYVDGVAYPAPAYNPGFSFTTTAAIGGRGDNLDNSFLGTIDEVSVYNRALSSDEIAAIYQADSLGKCVPLTPPTIAEQPTNQTVPIGGNATFIVVASGTPPLSYQWSFNGTNIADATNATLNLANVQLTNSGGYTVLVSNLFGSTNSMAAVLTVYGQPPTITSQPASQSAYVGTTVQFMVGATGTVPLSYQWNFNGTNIVNATNATLYLANVQLTNSGNYTVLVSNLFGSTNSMAAVLTVYGQPPTITSQPVSQSAYAGTTVQLMVVAAGTAPLSYQWNFNGTNIVNATNTTLILTNVQVSQSGNYSVAVTNAYGSTNSAIAVLTVTQQQCDPPPSGIVSWWPGEGNANDVISANNGTLVGAVVYTNGEVGQAFAFNGYQQCVTVGNPTNLQLQNFTIEAWVRRASSSVTTGPGGNGIIFGYGANGYAMFLGTGGVASLTKVGVDQVQSAAAITDTNFHHLAVTKSGSTVTFYVDGIAYAAPAYNSVFSFSTVAAIGGRGDNLDNSFLGTIDEAAVYNRALSSNEIVTIYQAGSFGKCSPVAPPTILTQPANQTNQAGGTATFSVLAIGAQPLAYQWSFNGTNLANATNAVLSLGNVQLTNAGNYSVLITNLYGATNSATAVLTVIQPQCDPPPSGIVSWWPGEGNPYDIIGTNNGTLVGGVTYTNGKVGQSFAFNGYQQCVTVGNPTNLQLQNFTIEAWVKRASSSVTTGPGGNGIIFGYGANGYALFLGPGGVASLTKVGVSQVQSTASITDTNFHHLAVTKSNSVVFFYVDGVAYSAPAYNPGFSFTTVAAIGGRGDNLDNSFLGTIDETAIYNRALSSNEIAAIYQAGSFGKCSGPLSPIIITQPTNQTAQVGGTASFTVLAAGAPPLYYQWTFNTNILSGATNATLTLTNEQLANAGVYALTVTNAFGAAVSSNATLTVIDALDHFTWSTIPTPRFVHTPFTVAIQARDSIGQVFTNFTGSVNLSTTNGAPVNPPVSGAFAQGLWSGSVLLLQTGSNLVLQASDSAGHIGLANPINVVPLPSVSMTLSGSTLYLFWPVDPAGFVLESTPALAPPQWIQVSNPPIQIGNQYLEPLTISATNAYYRLRFTLP